MALELSQLAVSGRLAETSWQLNDGEMLGVIGANGAGKSTLLTAIAGLLPSTGELHLGPTSLKQLAAQRHAQLVGYLPQSQHSAWALNVEDIVALGRLPWHDRNPQAIEQALQQCDLLALRKRRVSELSGGEQARVWLARVLAGQAPLLLADEPIASLDLRHQRNVMQVLREHAQGRQMVIVSIHDLTLAARYCDKLCLLDQGRLLAFGTAQEVLQEAYLEQAFGLPLKVDWNHFPPLIQAP